MSLCYYPHCKLLANYLYYGHSASRCEIHKKRFMLSIYYTRCKVLKCLHKPILGFSADKPLYCRLHQSLIDLSIINFNKQHICMHSQCASNASFGPINGVSVYCSLHNIEPTYVNLTVKKCEEPTGCTKIPTYGFIKGIATRCVQHKIDGMKDVKHKVCEEKDCTTRASQGYTPNKPLRCITHILENMKDVVRKYCEEPGCESRPTYGSVVGSATHCVMHKKANMDDVRHKDVCDFPGCGVKRPTYGFEKNKPTRCSQHKIEGMTDVLNKMCIEPGCKIAPSYALPGRMTALYCVLHLKDDMVNIRKPECTYPKCTTSPTYGYENEKAERCLIHKLINMVDVRHKRCIDKGCKFRAYFGIPGYTAEYCVKHKKSGMIANSTKVVVDHPCKTCCTVQVHHDEEFCINCKITEKNNNTTIKVIRKEIVIKSLLEENNISFTHNSVAEAGCSRKRPDFLITSNKGVVILEVDEDQHKMYDCEITRMKQIYHDVGTPNLIFIRYNPDEYKGLNQYGTPQRHKYLLQTLKKYMQELPIGLTFIQLFYNQFDPTTVFPQQIDPYQIAN